VVMVHLLIDIAKKANPDRVAVVKANERLLNLLTRLAGEWFEVEYYTRVDPSYLGRLNPKSVVIGGSGIPWEHYTREGLKGVMEAIRGWRKPLIGLCGGHQLLAMAYGARVDYIRRAEPGEPTDKPGGYYYGYLKETGWREVYIAEEDPLFKGLPRTIVVDEGHYAEVKGLPKGFKLLAWNETTRIQAMRLEGYPVYGVQFHPHKFDEEHPHGETVLRNFFDIARSFHEMMSIT